MNPSSLISSAGQLPTSTKLDAAAQVREDLRAMRRRMDAENVPHFPMRCPWCDAPWSPDADGCEHGQRLQTLYGPK